MKKFYKKIGSTKGTQSRKKPIETSNIDEAILRKTYKDIMKPASNMFVLTDEQEAVIQAAVNWWNNETSQLFQFDGFGGTGKSVVLSEILRRINVTQGECAPCAYTGAAAIVMRRKGIPTAKTIHSWIYEAVEERKRDENGNIIIDEYYNVPITRTKFVLRNLEHIKLMVIDEASMVPLEIRRDIEKYKNIRVIATGDLHQLPPVSGSGGYLTTGDCYHLTKIMRQAENSPIVYLSMRAYNELPIHKGYYGNNVWVINEEELTDDILKRAPMILCSYNGTRDRANDYLRNLHMGRPASADIVPLRGDRLVCRKNNWGEEINGINLVNGLIGTVVSDPRIDKKTKNTFNIDFLADGCGYPFENLDCDSTYFNADAATRRRIKENPYFEGNKFEYAYAITVHLSQGSQFPWGVVFEENMRTDNNRLFYTAITRFSNSLIYVKHKNPYY